MTQDQTKEVLEQLAACAREIAKGCEQGSVTQDDLLMLVEATGELHACAVKFAVAFPVAAE